MLKYIKSKLLEPIDKKWDSNDETQTQCSESSET